MPDPMSDALAPFDTDDLRDTANYLQSQGIGERDQVMLRWAADRIEALEAELRLVAEECAASGGEYWMGTVKPGPILAQMYREALDA